MNIRKAWARAVQIWKLPDALSAVEDNLLDSIRDITVDLKELASDTPDRQDIDDRFEKMDEEVQTLDRQGDSLQDDVDDLDKRLGVLEARVNKLVKKLEDADAIRSDSDGQLRGEVRQQG